MSNRFHRGVFFAVAVTALGVLFAVGNVTIFRGQGAKPKDKEAKKDDDDGFPRMHRGAGGPLGSDTDRGKLVPGLRDPDLPPAPVVTPDGVDLPYKMVDGVKEFHLHAQPVKRELLPGSVMNHWGYNGSLPGPTIQAVQGDRVRIVLHNELPEPTSLHLHGLELRNSQDGIPFVTEDPVMPGKTKAYEYKLHQTGTYFYHPHFAMQEAIGMVGLFIVHPKKNFTPAVDHDFALISQEFRIEPAANTPSTSQMDFNWLTFNGRCGPFGTPLVVKLGSRVRIRFLNFSTADHHPFHLHGHTFWITGASGGRIPPSAWMPENNVLVGVAQVREVEFIANNPGDWVMHCHMFHHMMNHMVPGVGPGSRKLAHGGGLDPRYKIPCFPQGAGMMAEMTPAQVKKIHDNPMTRGMAPLWYKGVHGLFTVVRVLPPELYDRVVNGNDPIPAGASVPGGKFMMRPDMPK